MKKKFSSATKRAFQYPDYGREWFCGFEYTPVKGLGYEEGIHRRDPSSIIKVGNLYYVYYTKSIGLYFGRSHKGNPDLKLFPWDQAEIWYATSSDGINWTEKGCAVARGRKGFFDERTVCTPDVLAYEEKYYLVYQTQAKSTFYTGVTENIGMSIAESPDGPWKKVSYPILKQMDEGKWFGETDSYNKGNFQGVTHDPMLFFYKGKFWLYYKCAMQQDNYPTNGLKMRYSGPDTRWGVATSKKTAGPYTHSEYNPVTNSGHETMLWHYDGGIAALINRDGPEKDTIQYAKDGINFEIMAKVETTPQAGGAFRCENTNDYPLAGLRWGLCHIDERGSLWNYIVRFDIDPRLTYIHPLIYPKSKSIYIF
jgi:hypothetical protein